MRKGFLEMITKGKFILFVTWKCHLSAKSQLFSTWTLAGRHWIFLRLGSFALMYLFNQTLLLPVCVFELWNKTLNFMLIESTVSRRRSRKVFNKILTMDTQPCDLFEIQPNEFNTWYRLVSFVLRFFILFCFLGWFFFLYFLYLAVLKILLLIFVNNQLIALKISIAPSPSFILREGVRGRDGRDTRGVMIHESNKCSRWECKSNSCWLLLRSLMRRTVRK